MPTRIGEVQYPKSLRATLIAPCGMNCGVCIAHLRLINQCMGCNAAGADAAKHCLVCHIKNCDEIRAAGRRFCFECASFPCARLRQLDKRYRTKYRMSMIENLESIRELGLRRFVGLEKERWRCAECGGVVCVHKEACVYCGHPRSY